MRPAQLRITVRRIYVVCLPGVVSFGWFATEPAEDGGVAYPFGSCLVIALVMSSLLVAIVLPSCLALVAALDVGGELPAYKAWSLDGHDGYQSSDSMLS